MARPYKNVKYQSTNGFEYPYWDIKTAGDPPPSPSPTPSITPTTTVTPTPSPSAPPSATPTPTPTNTPPYDYDRNYEFTIDTRNTNGNSSGVNSFFFSLTNSSFTPVGLQNQVRIYWGDGSSDLVSTSRNHTYTTPGIYTIRVEVTASYVLSDICGFEFSNTATPYFEGDAVKVTSVSIVSPEYALNKPAGFNDFLGCRNLVNFTGQATQLTLNTPLDNAFRGCNSLTSGLANWNVSGVTNMSNCFQECTSYNEDISGWDTSNVTSFGAMFYSATTFNRNLGSWDISSVSTNCSTKGGMTNMFGLSNLQKNNYDQILIGWEAQSPPVCINLFGVPCGYTTTGQAARNSLTSTYAWLITDGGLVP
jgi:surface protein